jgi:hypothetical protein
MESLVYCPVCGELAQVILAPYNEFMNSMTAMIEQAAGIEKSTHFEGQGKCKCGKSICATIHVTTILEEKDDKR